MKVIEFIKENGLQALTEQYAISVKKVDDLLMLNYNQIDSPKTDPIVMECRSLILQSDTLEVVSRSFSRFFNHGEALNVTPEIDWGRAVVYEKVDGSLIKIYYHKGRWNISTKGTVYGESDCMGFGVTFRELVLKALSCEDDNHFQSKCNTFLFEGFTYIFELTSVENRVVKCYEGYKLHYLACRGNFSGDHIKSEKGQALMFGAHEIKEYRFNTVDDCLKTARELKDLDEGFVVYQDGVPVSKIKSPEYVAVHHLRDSMNMGRDSALIPVVVTGESDEVISYFPEYGDRIREIESVWRGVVESATEIYVEIKNIEGQKEFAQAVMSNAPKLSAVMFSARKLDKSPRDVIMSLETNRKVKLVEEHLK
jgi:T4 RnlA family RNA ligase